MTLSQYINQEENKMAISFAVRLVAFISKDWVDDPFSFAIPPGYRSQFKGDNRTFSKNTDSPYRGAQQINVTFTNSGGSYVDYKNTGETVQRLTNISTGQYTDSTGKADPAGLTCKVDTAYLLGGDSDYYRFLCEGDIANPLVQAAPATNYKFYVSVHKNGLIQLEGLHDGYPSYEVYASVNGGTWQNIYLFNEKNLLDLAPPMEIDNVFVQRNIL